MIQFDFKDKVVLVTGASRGMGAQILRQFVNAGGHGLLNFLPNEQNLADANALIHEFHSHGKKCDLAGFDVSQELEVQQHLEMLGQKFGKLDVLINNAGISMRAMFEDCEVDVIKKVMDINFYGMVYATKYALPYIKKAKGSIVGISSIAGYRGLPVRIGYSASKFAMNGFLEALRTELLYEDVHVLTACPGFTASNIRVASLGGNGQTKGETMMVSWLYAAALLATAFLFGGMLLRSPQLLARRLRTREAS